MRWRDASICITLFVIALSIRYLGIHTTCMVGDEWLYWTKTNMILANDWKPVPEVFECSPPFLPHICALIATIFGSNLYVFRTVSVIFGALTVPLMYLFAKELYDDKVAVVSAVILCFTAYHCYYSRIYKLDAFTIFLIVAFLYVFWLSERSERYLPLAGLILGLAVDAKYLPAFLAFSVAVYYFWIYGLKNSLKRLFILYFFAFLSFLPLLVGLFVSGAGLQPFYYYTVGMFHRGGIAQRPIQYFTLGNLIQMGLEKVCDVFVYGADLAGPLVSSIVKISTLIILIFVTIFYMLKTIRKNKQESFLFISIIFLIIILLVIRISKYYLLYLVPFYAPMISYTFVRCLRFEGLDVLRAMYIFTVIVYLSFVIVSGMTSPRWDRGEYSWAMDAINFIKVDSFNIKGRPVVIGTFIFVNEPIEYDAFTVNLSVEVYNLGIVKPYPEESKLAILRQINLLKPDYIIMVMEPISFYGMYFNGKLKEEILKDYRIAYITNSYPYKALILKRKKITAHNVKLPFRRGYVDHEFFVKSIPDVLRHSRSYVFRVKVKNVGKSPTKFTVRLHTNKFIIYIYHRFQNVTLNPGQSAILAYRAFVMSTYFERIPICVDVYKGYVNQSLNNIVDTDKKYVLYIR